MAAASDVALNAGVPATRGLDRFISFDADQGILGARRDASQDVIDVALSRGWFLPVVPGTLCVGGAVQTTSTAKAITVPAASATT
jgi:hypothetical protein